MDELHLSKQALADMRFLQKTNPKLIGKILGLFKAIPHIEEFTFLFAKING